MAPVTSRPPMPSTAARCPSDQRSAGRYTRRMACSTGLSLWSGRRNARHSTGITKIDRSSDESSASATVKASGENIFPSSPCSVTMGTKVSAMISSPRMLGRRTSMAAARTTASRSPVCPFSASRRWTFSTWMIVASMIMPMEMARPPSDMRFASMPATRSTVKVSRIDSGSARITTNAPRALRSRRSNTARTRMQPAPSASSTVRVLASTTSDRR